MIQHNWWDSSGTTTTCEVCGCVRYSETSDGRAISNPRAERYVYARKGNRQDWQRSNLREPPCVKVERQEVR